MKIIHDPRNGLFRSPFGALPCGTEVRLTCIITDQETVKDVFLCYLYGLDSFEHGKMYMEESPDTRETFSCRMILPAEPCLLFYWFEVNTENQIRYHNKAELSQDRRTVDGGFQITVFRKGFRTPDWMKKSVIYQIFPDRFARDSGYSYEKMISNGHEDERIYHKDWHEDVDYSGKDGRNYQALDFFGGSLDGIKENLAHIKSLGVSVIYLNPIFQSRSNHRYDTGDYEKIDPILGGNEAFDRFVRACSEQGIRIILDGVFSHTGADSKYFNKYGRYQETGAYQDAAGHGRSEWYNWYSFDIRHGKIYYDSWWNFADLPNVNESDLSYREYILGINGVLRKWLNRGISGWRLDVSDELPDKFLRNLREAAKEEDPDSVILGEVWEDASNKISYGGYRDFLLGNTHDCVMGYPFRRILLDWLTHKISLRQTIEGFEKIRENYPAEAYLCNMNLIGSHDVARAITVLAGADDNGEREWQSRSRLSPDDRRRGSRLLKLAMMVQFTFPGVPAVYYGDELAMEGYGDPFCRRTFDINKALNDPPETLLWLRAISAFRRSNSNLSTGHIRFVNDQNNILIYSRFSSDGFDMAGEATDDDRSFYVAVNPDEYSKKISLDGEEFELDGMSGVIISDGNRVFET